MYIASGLALTFHPTHRIADDGQKVDLETMIPKQFGGWHEVQQGGLIINPQMKETIERLYSQTLSRSYINGAGDYIMLSIAYGPDQGERHNQMHYPELCYPAQGFQVLTDRFGVVKTDFGEIRVKRLLTVQGNRSEPLTYWATVGNKVALGGYESRIEQLRYGIHGKIPDGILFRVSSITKDAEAGYASQQEFIRLLLAAISTNDRLRLAGLTGQSSSPDTSGVKNQ